MEIPITTIEGLAELIHETMASKEDINRVEVRLDGIDVVIVQGVSTVRSRRDLDVGH